MAKRLFDLAFAALTLLLIGPLLLGVALWVRLDSPGPVFFRQQRVGLSGRLFGIYKFRTMYTGAEAKGLQLTVGADARVTRAGRHRRRAKHKAEDGDDGRLAIAIIDADGVPARDMAQFMCDDALQLVGVIGRGK